MCKPKDSLPPLNTLYPFFLPSGLSLLLLLFKLFLWTPLPVAGFEQSSNMRFLSSVSGETLNSSLSTEVGRYHFLRVQLSNVVKSLLREWSC